MPDPNRSSVNSGGALAQLIAGIVTLSSVLALPVVTIAAVLAIISAQYVVKHFALNTDTTRLVAADLDWRKQEAAFESIFPQPKNLILIVIDGATPEQASDAARALDQALRQKPDLFTSIRRPGSGAFFEKNGLLLLPIEQTQAALDSIIAAQPFLGALAADPSPRGVMDSLGTALVGVDRGQVELDRLTRPMAQLNGALENFFAGKPAFLSWRKMTLEGEPDLRETRQLIEALVKVDFGALKAGGKPSAAIRDTVKTLGLTPENGVTVRLTGPVPIFDEEFATLTENVVLIASAVIGAILIMLWLAIHSVRLMLSIVATILVGLAITTALGLMMVGAFNIISVAFVALFVGLGIDFGIQFSVRYRAERLEMENRPALAATGAGIGPALTLAALSITAGFLGFLPTSYRGVAELGLIAGVGMALTFLLSITLLPALITLSRPAQSNVEVGFKELAWLDGFLGRFPRFVLLIGTAAGVAALLLLAQLTFDFNLINLRSRQAESIATLLDLAHDPDASPNTMDVVVPTREAAAELTNKLVALPQVIRVLSINDFVPSDQDEKLALIGDAAMLLDPTLNPVEVKPAPTDAELVESFTATAAALRKAAAGTSPASGEATKLAGFLERLATADAMTRAAASELMTRGLTGILDRVRNLLLAEPFTLEMLPQDLARDFIAPSGEVRVKIYPSGDPTDTASLSKFREAVVAFAPQAVGVPVSLEESGRTIVGAFVEAGLWSFLAIALLLWLVLRSVRDVILALAPLVLAGALTLATCVAIGLKLNYANIIALPLLFGIGVAFDIYFVMAWRNGARDLLQSPLTRAVIFSAGTTATGFGALWFSSHPGTASMGELLMISLAWILVVVLFVLPPLLHIASGRESIHHEGSK